MPLQETSGNVTTDAYGGGVAAVPQYIEDVFSTWLYSATGATQSITNGIDLAGKGGMVWIKDRTLAYNNCLFDTTRGVGKSLYSNTTNAQVTDTPSLTNFNNNGFTLGADSTFGYVNNAGNLASWTFRKQPKFFDVVTGTQSVAGNVTFNHNLGSVPGLILLKSTSTVTGGGEWYVYHRSLGTSQYLNLNTTAPASSAFAAWGGVAPTSTQFTMGYVYPVGTTVVAYLFAHNAGGFGLTGTDNVISCGSYTGNGSTTGPIVTLGYEPQWVLLKRTDDVDDWNMADNMRGMAVNDTTTFNTQRLRANLSNAEGQSGWISPLATGFQIIGGNAASASYNASGGTYIYIAIRRGPMKVPTDGATVFKPIAATNTYGTKNTTSFPVDMQIATTRNAGSQARRFVDRLRGISTNSTGAGQVLESQSTAAEITDTYETLAWDNTGYQTNYNYDSLSTIYYNMRRAPSFFDEVCYTGTGSITTVTHNLGVAPELMLIKSRSNIRGWAVYASGIGASKYLILNGTYAALNDPTMWANTAPTSSVFTVGTPFDVNNSGYTYVAYLFATCAGVSKVGTYTGNGSTQTINCGFTGGARFVLIKRTDAAGDWYVYDTARGMTTLTDPYLLLNSTAAESATLGSVTTVSTGFAVNASILAAINTNGASYIFFSVA